MKIKFLKQLLVLLVAFCMISNDALSVLATTENQKSDNVVTVESYRYRDRPADEDKIKVYSTKPNFYASKTVEIKDGQPIKIPIVKTNDFKIKAVDIYDVNNAWKHSVVFNDDITTEEALKQVVDSISSGDKVQVYYHATTGDHCENVDFYDYSIIGETTVKETVKENINYKIGDRITFTYNGETYSNVREVGNYSDGFEFRDENDEPVATLNTDLGIEKDTTFTDVTYGGNHYDKVITEHKVNKWNTLSLIYSHDIEKTKETFFNAGVNQFENTLAFGRNAFSNHTLFRQSAGGEQDANINNAAVESDATHAIFQGIFDDIIGTDKDHGYFTNENTEWKNVYANAGYKLDFYREGHRHILRNSVAPNGDETIAFNNPEGISQGMGVDEFANNCNRNFFPLDNERTENGALNWDTKSKLKALGGAEKGVLEYVGEGEEGHNCFFGMKYTFEFTIGDYTGPMIFAFVGDDDLWVTVDDDVVLDLGGLHQAYPTTYYGKGQGDSCHVESSIDIRDYLVKNNKYDTNKKYKVSVYYMERGGWESSCYIDYVLPNATPVIVNPIIPDETGNIEFNKVDEKGNALDGAIFKLYKTESDAINETNELAEAKSINGKVSFADLEEGTYYVKETSAPNGYIKNDSVYETVVIADKTVGLENVNNNQVVNTKAEKISINVKKVWKDGNNQDGLRPETVKVQLLAGGKPQGDPVTLNEANSWKHTWSNLDQKLDGKEIKYTVEEVNVPEGYDVDNSGVVNNTITLTNIHTPATRSLSVAKVWNDEDDQDGLRPETVKVQLLAGGKPQGNPVTLNEANSWKHTWENLAQKSNGKEIEYTVQEVNVPEGYTVAYGGVENNTITMTNTHIPGTRSLSVVKVWKDGNNQDGLRPETVKVQLLAGGKPQGDPVTLNEANSWKHTWSNLDQKLDGKEIKYTVEEVNVPEGYDVDNSGVVNNTITLTNIHTPATRSLSVAKVWNDEDDQDGLRPETVKVQLLAGGKPQGEAVTLNEANSWKHTWENLAQKSNGKEIEYTVQEVNVPEGYTVAYGGVENNTITMTNTHIPGTRSLSVVKVWKDGNNQDGLRPETVKVQLLAGGKPQGDPVTLNEANSWKHTWSNLDQKLDGKEIKYTVEEVNVPEGYDVDNSGVVNNTITLTNIHTPATRSLSVVKVWKDGNNQDGLRPETVKVQLLAGGKPQGEAVTLNEANSWKHTWENLAQKSNGKEIEYTVQEVNVPEGYTVAYGGVENNTITMTNTHIPGTRSLSVVKVWKDGNNQDGLRPETVKVQLLAGGKPQGDPVTLNEANSWKHTWSNLDQKLDGEDIVYTVQEVEVPKGYEVDNSGVVNNTITLTNIHTPATRSLSVDKVWNDEDDQDGLRPETVKVQLYADGKALGKEVTLNKANSWKHTWENLAQKSNGEDIVYTVQEVNVPEGYTVAYGGVENNTITMTNTHIPGTRSLSVVKVWKDENNQDGMRPETVIVQLLAGGKPQGDPVTLNEANSWKHTWSNLDQKLDGEDIVYTVQEVEVPKGYDVDNSGVVNNTITLTNIHTPATRSLSVVKVWNDEDDQDGLRPETVKVQLLADGNKLGNPVTLNEANSWKHTWENLAQKSNGEDIVYTVQEVNVPEGYTVAYGGVENNTITITNVHQVEKLNINGQKTWNDQEDLFNLRPENITIHLFANETEVDKVNVTKDNQWKYSFTNLPKYDKQGKKIVYHIEEDYVPYYTTTIKGYDVINTLELTQIKVTKVWDVPKNMDLPSVTIALMNQTKVVDEIILSPKTGWTYTFTDLLKFDENGNEIQYTIKETKIGFEDVVYNEIGQGSAGNFTVSINNGIITNAYHEKQPELINISGVKTWIDDNDKAKQRPNQIVIRLFADGKEVASKIVSKKDNWLYSFEGLLKYNADGKEINYMISEDKVEGYQSEINNFDIQNTYISKSNTPQTYDDSPIALVVSTIIISSIIVALLSKKKKRITK